MVAYACERTSAPFPLSRILRHVLADTVIYGQLYAVLTFQGLILALQYGSFNSFRCLCINCRYVVSLLFHVVLGYLMIHGFDEAAGGAVAQHQFETVAGGEVGCGLDGAAVAEDVGAAGTEHGHGVSFADTELEHVELA